MPTDKLAALDAKIAQLEAQRAKIKAAESKAAKSLRDRQNIILGAWVQANRPDVLDACKQALTRSQDRAAFGLQSLENATAPAAQAPGPFEAAPEAQQWASNGQF